MRIDDPPMLRLKGLNGNGMQAERCQCSCCGKYPTKSLHIRRVYSCESIGGAISQSDWGGYGSNLEFILQSQYLLDDRILYYPTVLRYTVLGLLAATE